MRRFLGPLLLVALAIPASLSLPSTRMAGGQSCKMACAHGTGMACCCAEGGGAASFRRCPTPGDWFVQAPATRGIVPALPSGAAAPPLAGIVALWTVGFLLRVYSERPDPVPKLLS